jgi:hypothetical protein
MDITLKKLKRMFPDSWWTKIGIKATSKHQASKRGYKHNHGLSKGQQKSIAYQASKMQAGE